MSEDRRCPQVENDEVASRFGPSLERGVAEAGSLSHPAKKAPSVSLEWGACVPGVPC